MITQGLKQLEDQKTEAKDRESKKDIELELKLKRIEGKLAGSKLVSQGNNFAMNGCCI